jgi:hypothetical protein
MNDDLGLTREAAMRAFAFTSTAAPAVPLAIPPAAPTTPTPPPAPVEPHTRSGLSPSEAAKMTTWTKQDLASGKIPAEQADKIFSELNVPADQRATPADLRDDEQKLWDQHFPVARPEEFSIRYGRPGEHVEMTKELTALDSSARAWLSGGDFDRTLGNSLVSAIERTVQTTKGMNEDQLESYGYAEYQKLERAYGSELDDKLQAAGRMVEELDKKSPGLKSLLRARGIGDNAMVASMLIQQSERWHARRKGR